MIQATFVTKRNQILSYRVEGHAAYSNLGQDIVCAAVSSLYTALTNRLLMHGSVLTREEITFVGKSEIEQELADALYGGLKQIAEQYPENVRVVVLDV